MVKKIDIVQKLKLKFLMHSIKLLAIVSNLFVIGSADSSETEWVRGPTIYDPDNEGEILGSLSYSLDR